MGLLGLRLATLAEVPLVHLLYMALEVRLRAFGVGLSRSPGSQWLGHREREQTLPPS